MNRVPRLLPPASALLLATLAPSTFAQPSFQGLGGLPSPTLSSSAEGISPDGGTVVGIVTTDEGSFAFRWTQQTGMIALPYFDAHPPYSGAQDASALGQAICGASNTPSGAQAFLWTSANGIRSLGTLVTGAFPTYASAVTPDGRVVVGQGRTSTTAFTLAPWRWTAATGMVRIGNDLQGGALDVSDDGNVVVGAIGPTIERLQGFVWTSAEGLHLIGPIPGETSASALHAVTPSGSAATGWESPDGSQTSGQAILWTSADGLTFLGTLPGTTTSVGRAISADASIVVGGSGNGGDSSIAFIWDPIHGMRALKAVLEQDYHLDLTGWELEEALGMSRDGTVMVGRGVNPLGNTQAWIARLPSAACPADFNHDNTITSQDFFDFLTAFFAGCP